MSEYRYYTLREIPELKGKAAEWFHSKWGVPKEAYLECMAEYLDNKTELKSKGVTPIYLVTDHTGFYERYGWEFLCMVQGDGEPNMTRMYIHK